MTSEYTPFYQRTPVASHAGAWIETWERTMIDEDECVAPHAGRGLKRQVWEAYKAGKESLPIRGAWIETTSDTSE